MKKYLSLLTAFIFVVLCASCTGGANPPDTTSPETNEVLIVNPKNENFEITVSLPQNALKVGDSFKFEAELKNISGKDLKIGHGVPLLGIEVYKKGERPNYSFGASLTETEIKANESIKKTSEYQFAESGTYCVSAVAAYTLDKNETMLRTEIYEITVA